jgi:hypothetical protein
MPLGVESNKKCSIENNPASVVRSVDFEFWYAVGLTNSTVLDDTGLFELEQMLYTSIDEQVLWCISREDRDDQVDKLSTEEGDDTENSGGAGTRRRRFLSEANVSSTAKQEVIGPVVFTPGRKDEVTDSTCLLLSSFGCILTFFGAKRIVQSNFKKRMDNASWSKVR